MNFIHFQRNLALENAGALQSFNEVSKEGIFDSEKSLLDFEEALDEKDEEKIS